MLEENCQNCQMHATWKIVSETRKLPFVYFCKCETFQNLRCIWTGLKGVITWGGLARFAGLIIFLRSHGIFSARASPLEIHHMIKSSARFTEISLKKSEIPAKRAGYFLMWSRTQKYETFLIGSRSRQSELAPLMWSPPRIIRYPKYYWDERSSNFSTFLIQFLVKILNIFWDFTAPST